MVIDDFADEPEFQPKMVECPDGGIKKLMTYRIVNDLANKGALRKRFQINDTLFASRSPGETMQRIDSRASEGIIEAVKNERATAVLRADCRHFSRGSNE